MFFYRQRNSEIKQITSIQFSLQEPLSETLDTAKLTVLHFVHQLEVSAFQHLKPSNSPDTILPDSYSNLT